MTPRKPRVSMAGSVLAGVSAAGVASLVSTVAGSAAAQQAAASITIATSEDLLAEARLQTQVGLSLAESLGATVTTRADAAALLNADE